MITFSVKYPLTLVRGSSVNRLQASICTVYSIILSDSRLGRPCTVVAVANFSK